MKKFRTSLIILGIATLQGCCCGMSGFPGGKHIPNSDLYWFFKRLNGEAVPVSTSRPVLVPAAKSSASDLKVCETASENGSKWNNLAFRWVKEAKDRNLTLDDCRKIIFEPLTDQSVCKSAIEQTTNLLHAVALSEWVEEPNAWVEEAKGRNLTLDECRKILLGAATDKEVCRSAVAMNGEWETNPHLIGWKTEAMQRGFTMQSCTPIVLSEHTDKSICMFSIRNDEWNTEDLLYVNEAKRRGLSPIECETL